MKKTLKTIVSFILDPWFILIVFLFIVGRPFLIPSESMEPKVNTGDYLYVNLLSYGMPTPRIPFTQIDIIPGLKDRHIYSSDRPEINDIVVFREKGGTTYIKRVIEKDKNVILFNEAGLFKLDFTSQSDYVFNEQHWIKINYSMTVDPKKDFENIKNYYIAHKNNLTLKHSNGMDYFNYTLEQDQYFMLGDNKLHSIDSRYFGPIDYADVFGKPIFKIFSLKESSMFSKI